MRTRRMAALASVVLVGATLAPLLRDPARDSHPLSTYPMFASRRSSIDYAVGSTATGERRALPTRAYGTGEIVQAASAIERAVTGGITATIAACEAIAVRAAAESQLADLATIRIVTAPIVDGEPGPELEEARCAVPR